MVGGVSEIGSNGVEDGWPGEPSQPMRWMMGFVWTFPIHGIRDDSIGQRETIVPNIQHGQTLGKSSPWLGIDPQNFTTRNDGGKLIDHVISRLEPQILDYVEKNQRLEFGIPRYKPKREQCFPNGNRQENWRDNSRPRREFNRFESQGVADNRRFDGRRRGGQSDQRFHNQGGRQGGSRNSAFRGQNDQNRYLNF
ncbi:uncharacterized protein TNCV_5057341 [Trichonephila clavipes]|nr:uncharacterized protein TNCV_5057341 [Trichonephila clavipes]